MRRGLHRLVAFGATALAISVVPAAHAQRASGGASFPGRYRIERAVTVNLTSPWPLNHQEVQRVRIDVTRGNGATSDLVFNLTSPTQSCRLEAQRSGPRSVTFRAGQTCNQQAMGGTVVGTMVSGSGELQGAALTMEFAWTLSGSVMGGRITGTGSDRVTGRRF